ncbi:MAG: MotA/TolQ/ExbB proton channel family protein [Planctomycetes bacterium]|nr:MotA/TolQ/ExbB proton channel family protein [Planctomycetota bacterium]
MTKIQNSCLLPILFLICSCGAYAQGPASGVAGTFYHQFFTAGGPIVWFVLLPMSIVTVYLAVDLLVSIRRSRLLPPGLSSEIATHAMRYGVNSLFARLAGQTDLVSRAVLRSIDQRRQLGGSIESARQYAAEALQERGLQLMRKTQWCQIIGSVAPMVGLFGTVFGMIQAFNLLGQGGEGPRYELLAEAISVALVTTFWGLLVGIPALFFYGMFQTRIEAFISEAAIETDSLLGRIFEAPNAGLTETRPPEPLSSESLD